MQVGERIVFLVATIIIVSLAMYIVLDINYLGFYESLDGLFNQENDIYVSVDGSQLPLFIYSTFKNCGFGASNQTSFVYFNNGGEDINIQTDVFDAYIRFNLCSSMQNKDYGCGNRNILNFIEFDGDIIKTKSLLKLDCSVEFKTLNVSVVS